MEFLHSFFRNHSVCKLLAALQNVCFIFLFFRLTKPMNNTVSFFFLILHEQQYWEINTIKGKYSCPEKFINCHGNLSIYYCGLQCPSSWLATPNLKMTTVFYNETILVKTTLSRTLNYLVYNNIIVSSQHKYLLLFYCITVTTILKVTVKIPFWKQQILHHHKSLLSTHQLWLLCVFLPSWPSEKTKKDMCYKQYRQIKMPE